MNSRFVILLLAVLLPWGVCAQEAGNGAASQAATQSLSVRPTIGIASSLRTQFPGPTFNRVACDGSGNLYARRFQGDKGREPVEEIARTGALIRSFKVDDPSLNLSIGDFFVGPQDELYMLGWSMEHVHSGGRVYIAQFGRDGSLKSKTQVISEEMFPSSLAVFKSGEFLLTGRQGPGDNTPFTGVFASTGRLIAKIYEPEDEDLRKKADAGDASAHDARLYGNTAVSLGGAVGGWDGNVYVMRRTSPALIYVISPKGEVVRKLRIDPGDSTSLPEELQSSADRLAISFAAPDGTRFVKVVDLKGNDVAEYQMPSEWAGALACYDARTFTFLSPGSDGSNYMRIEKSEAR